MEIIDGLRDYWRENIQKNLKKISATIGDIIITTFTVILFAWKSNLDAISALFITIMALRPYITLYVNLITKGEASDAEKELITTQAQLNALKSQAANITAQQELKQQLSYERELAEFRVQLAAAKGEVPEAVKYNKDWVDTNEELEDLES